MNKGMGKPPIIVISSHVARGAVGNRAVVFALERLGFPVVSVPTIVLAWHPGEGQATRIVPPDEAFRGLIGDLVAAPWLGTVGGILSGYLDDAAQVGAIAGLVGAVKARNPRAPYLCDPVVGDVAGPYVSREVLAAIGEELVPLADIMTPNRHELGFLAHRDYSDNDGLVGAARQCGVGEVVVTSAFGGREGIANLLVASEGVYLARHTALAVAPHGTGDLIAALYLAHRLDGKDAPEALRMATGSTLRLIEMARGCPELPLAGGQAAFFEAHAGVSVDKVG